MDSIALALIGWLAIGALCLPAIVSLLLACDCDDEDCEQ